MTVICLSTKFFSGPIHYDASHCMPIKASNCSTSVSRKHGDSSGSFEYTSRLTLGVIHLVGTQDGPKN